MTYLTSYRNQSRKYGNPQDKAFKYPEPYKPPREPRHANDNERAPANDNERKPPARNNGPQVNFGQRGTSPSKLARALLYTAKGLRLIRVHPALNIALTAWDVAEALRRTGQSYQIGDIIADPVAAGWTSQTLCRSGPTGYTSTGPFNPWPSTFCLANQGVFPTSPYQDVNPNDGRLQVYKWHQFFGGTDRYYNQEWLWRSQSFAYRPRQRAFRQSPKPWIVPTPHELPIKWPMPLPLPLPMRLVNQRINDPLGSQRLNQLPGNARPMSPRKPPPSNTKERKITSKSQAVMLALQKAAHGVTEGKDLLDAVHKALPAKHRAKSSRLGNRWMQPTPQDKLRAVWKNWPSVNMNDMAMNLVKNEIGDRIVGRANARVSKGLKNTPIGRINMGPIFGGAN